MYSRGKSGHCGTENLGSLAKKYFPIPTIFKTVGNSSINFPSIVVTYLTNVSLGTILALQMVSLLTRSS